jgi:hypothetical protein
MTFPNGFLKFDNRGLWILITVIVLLYFFLALIFLKYILVCKFRFNKRPLDTTGVSPRLYGNKVILPSLMLMTP